MEDSKSGRKHVISAKVTLEERDHLDLMRRALRLRSNGEVIRTALELLDNILEMTKMMPPNADEQKSILSLITTLGKTVPDVTLMEGTRDTVLKEIEQIVRSE